MNPFGGSSKTNQNYSAEQTTFDGGAYGEGSSTLTLSGDRSKLEIDNSVDNSVDLKLSGNVGTTSGDGNTVLGTGASMSQDTYFIEDLGADVVDTAVGAVRETTADAFAFGARALASTDSAYSGGFDFADKVLDTLADFGSSTIQNANARADSALAAVERLAVIPNERVGSSAQDSRVVLYLFAAIAALALLFGLGGRTK